MTQTKATLILIREKSLYNYLRKYKVNIDHEMVGTISSGESISYQLPAGQHSISVTLDFYKSKTFSVELLAGENLILRCGDKTPKTFKEIYSLKGIEQMANSLIKSQEHLFIEKIEASDLVQEQEPVPVAQQKKKTQQPPPRPKPATKPSSTPSRGKGARLFLSYRRTDSGIITGRICDHLSFHYGEGNVFRDVDSIPLGVDFRQHIKSTMDKCDVALIIIGDEWLNTKNSAGSRRIDDNDDPVRLEIELAIELKVPLIPIFVKGAAVPSHDQMPFSLSNMSFNNGFVMPDEPLFKIGMKKLISDLDSLEYFQEKITFCTSCGNEVQSGYNFCMVCGHSIE